MRRGPVVLVAVGLLAMGGAAAASGSDGLPEQAAPAAVAHTHGPDPLALDRRGRVPAALPYDVDAYATWRTAEWTAPATRTEDQPDTANQAGKSMFHVVYLYGADAASRLDTFGAMIQADVRQASSRQATQYKRGLRFDLRTDGKVDITELRSSYVTGQLGSAEQFALVRQELVDRGFTAPGKKYVVWLDAPSQYCGQGELYPDDRRVDMNNNQLRTTAIVYRPYADDAGTGGFCRGRTLHHEIGHNMGALQPVAPHAFDGAHCNDSAEDVMCYVGATSFDSGRATFDYGNDDYWDPPRRHLDWWTVNLSSYVCPKQSC